jgi:hypothetical protein
MRAQYAPDRKSSVQLQLSHYLLDDNSKPAYMNKFRQDVSAWLMGYYRPTNDLRLRARVRYLDDAVDDNAYLERSVAALGEVASRVRDRDLVRVRLDAKFWLDKRTSTVEREPDPELSLWLFYEAKL